MHAVHHGQSNFIAYHMDNSYEDNPTFAAQLADLDPKIQPHKLSIGFKSGEFWTQFLRD
jgi:hypothetical protein